MEGQWTPISKKYDERFSSDRVEWSKYRNFDQIYDEVYNGMAEAGAAVKLDELMWVEKEGRETTKKIHLAERQLTY